MLVVLWTAFSAAFAAVFSTLFIPLSLAALGIVLRGAGFAFHRLAPGARERRVSQALFGLSSLLTPFFMGTVIGAVASGRVPLGNAEGDPVTSWLNAVSLLTGALFVATSAYLAAVFLVSDSRTTGDADLERYFTVRALGAAVAAGALAVAGIFVFRADARYIYDGLVGEALPLVILSVVCGLGVLALLRRGAHRGPRVLAVGAVVAMIWAWGVAQYPYLLPQTLTISDGAADPATLTEVLDRLRRRRVARAPLARPALRPQPAQHARGRGRLAVRPEQVVQLGEPSCGRPSAVTVGLADSESSSRAPIRKHSPPSEVVKFAAARLSTSPVSGTT